MKLSIAMATYNGGRFISEQLASFADQSRLPDELVVCDDQSSDDTIAILREFAAAAPFPVAIHRNDSRLGVIGNFERALGLCMGDIVFLSDQDDFWFDDKLACVVDLFERSGPEVQVVLNDQIITDGELRSSGRSKMQNLRDAGLKPDRMITGCCTAMRREWRDAVLPIPRAVPAHDDWIGGLARTAGVRSLIETPLQFYRRHGGNASDWVMSSAKGQKKSARLESRIANSLRSGRSVWARSMGLDRLFRERIIERRGAAAFAGIDVDAVLAKLDARVEAFSQRSQIYDLPRLARLPAIAGLVKTGGYRQFGGVSSALKDFFAK